MVRMSGDIRLFTFCCTHCHQKSSELATRYGRDVGLLENAITEMKSLVTMEQAKCKEYHAAVAAKEQELAEVRRLCLWLCISVRGSYGGCALSSMCASGRLSECGYGVCVRNVYRACVGME